MAVAGALAVGTAAFGTGIASGSAGVEADAVSVTAPAGSQVPPDLSPGSSATLTYCNGQRMYVTEPHGAGRHPAFVFVHGGDWMGGTYRDQGWVQKLQPALTEAGFVVAAIDYRLAPANKWPAMMQDTACSVRYLRAWSSRLHVDPTRIGGWGDSAGGQMVSLLGVAPDLPGAVEASDYAQYRDTLDAVIDMYGLVDLPAELAYLLHFPNGSYYADVEVRSIFGYPTYEGAVPVLAAGSATSYVARGDPPFLILQGTADTICPPSQSKTLAAELRAAGDPVRLIMVAHGQHGLDTPGERPDERQTVPVIVAWASAVLRP